MAGLIAVILFVLAFLFHGLKVAPNLWLDWQSLALAGLVFLAWAGIREWPVVVRRGRS